MKKKVPHFLSTTFFLKFADINKKTKIMSTLATVGNWIITDVDIDCSKVLRDPNYAIPVNRLLELGSGERNQVYDWLVHFVEKESSKAQIHSFNTAFILAATLWELPLDAQKLKNSILMQYQILTRGY